MVTQSLEQGLTAQQLVQYLIDPAVLSGITVQSVAYSGHNRAAGIISNAEGVLNSQDPGSLGPDSAKYVVLSTGNIQNAVNWRDSHLLAPTGPAGSGFDINSRGNVDLISTINGNPVVTDNSGDGDLERIMNLYPGDSYDAASLTVKFTSTLPYVKMVYVFASDEYNEFVNLGFSDVFGFILNGQNVALLPNSTVPASIDTVNNGSTPARWQRCTEPNAPDAQHPQYYVDNCDFHIATEMDGLTRVLTVYAPVSTTQVNTMKLAIADVGDHLGDSNVFMRFHSFEGTLPSDIPDADGDKIPDFLDNCARTYNPDQKDTDGDGVGDACDNCGRPNPTQTDVFTPPNPLPAPGTILNYPPLPTDPYFGPNGIGDSCELDKDVDGIIDVLDNCPLKFNPDQLDSNFNGIGDACESLQDRPFGFVKLTGGGQLPNPQVSDKNFGFNVQFEDTSPENRTLRVHLQYNDKFNGKNAPPDLKIHINALTKDFVSVITPGGIGLGVDIKSVPCLVSRSDNKADMRNVRRCQVVIVDNQIVSEKDKKSPGPADLFAIRILRSDNTVEYDSGPASIIRGNIQAHLVRE